MCPLLYALKKTPPSLMKTLALRVLQCIMIDAYKWKPSLLKTLADLPPRYTPKMLYQSSDEEG